MERAAWVMVSDRVGDTKQTLAIADAIGIPFETKYVIPPGGATRLHKGPRRFSPESIDPERSSRLAPPWPDVLVTMGSWPTAASLWVREQQGGRPRIVLIGRPRSGQLDCFTAIVAYPHHRIPDHPTVVRMSIPPLRPDPDLIRRESERWAPLLAGRSRPLTAVLVGGPTKPYRLDRRVGSGLASALGRLLRREGGSLYVVTSPRTPPGVIETLREGLTESTAFFDWQKDERDGNPYLGLLGGADRFVVTGDSVSMLVEVASLGRPLAIFELPRERSVRALSATARAWLASGALRSGSLAARLILEAHRSRRMGFPRDLGAFHRTLYDRGLAARFGTGSFATASFETGDELKRVGAGIRRLLGDLR